MNAGTTDSIRTGRLDLVPLEAGHADEMADALSDPRLHEFIGGQPLAKDALRTRYERLTAGSPDPDITWHNWVVRARGYGALVGTLQATVTTPPTGASRTAEIAWVIGTPWQGRGFATEAAQALLGWLAHESVGIVTAYIHPDNRASAATAAAAGLTPTRHTRDGETRWERTLAP